MEYKSLINEIIRRAEAIRLPLEELCAGAGVNKSTFYRWRQPEANPRMRSMMRALDAMEAELGRREGEIVEAIAGRRPEQTAGEGR